jgi:hypothetical protein
MQKAKCKMQKSGDENRDWFPFAFSLFNFALSCWFLDAQVLLLDEQHLHMLDPINGSRRLYDDPVPGRVRVVVYSLDRADETWTVA